MNDDRRFERSAHEWLQAGPDVAPDWVVQAAFQRIDTAPQEWDLRIQWRWLSMTPTIRVAGMILGVAVLSGGAIYFLRGSPGDSGVEAAPAPTLSATRSPAPTVASPTQPAPTAPPSPRSTATAAALASTKPRAGNPPLTERFTSSDAGLSLGYPSGWASLGPVDGALSIVVQLGESAEGVVPEARFAASSAILGDGETAEQWIDKRMAPAPDQVSCARPHNPAVTIGGQGGILVAADCPILGHRLHYLAVTVVGERGYVFHLDTTTFDRAFFEALLASVTFLPSPAAP